MELPNVELYDNKQYWEERFKQEEEYDWLCVFADYQELLTAHMHTDDKILVLGK